MRKTALTFTVTTLVLSVFGAFLHWLQTMNAFETDTGFAIPGAGTSIVYIVYSVLAIAAICLLVLLWLRRYDGAAEAGTALRSATALPSVVGWLLCVCVAAPACVLMFTAASVRFPMLQRIFGAAGIIGGLCFPFLTVRRGGEGTGALGRPAATVVTLFYCFWLVFFYKTFASENPILWSYVVEVLALAAAAAGFYYVTGFFFGAGRKDRALIAVQIGAYLCISALADEHQTAMSVMLAATAVMLLMLEFLLIENLTGKRQAE